MEYFLAGGGLQDARARVRRFLALHRRHRARRRRRRAGGSGAGEADPEHERAPARSAAFAAGASFGFGAAFSCTRFSAFGFGDGFSTFGFGVGVWLRRRLLRARSSLAAGTTRSKAPRSSACETTARPPSSRRRAAAPSSPAVPLLLALPEPLVGPATLGSHARPDAGDLASSSALSVRVRLVDVGRRRFLLHDGSATNSGRRSSASPGEAPRAARVVPTLAESCFAGGAVLRPSPRAPPPASKGACSRR